jgi:hypothetical protein
VQGFDGWMKIGNDFVAIGVNDGRETSRLLPLVEWAVLRSQTDLDLHKTSTLFALSCWSKQTVAVHTN